MALGGFHSEKGLTGRRPHLPLLGPASRQTSRGQGQRSAGCPPGGLAASASPEALHSSGRAHGWAEGVPRARLPSCHPTLHKRDTQNFNVLLADTHQSDVQRRRPESCYAGKQVTACCPPGMHVSPALPPAPCSRNSASPLRGVGTPFALQAEARVASARRHPPALLPAGSAAAAHTRSPIVLRSPTAPSSRCAPRLAERRPPSQGWKFPPAAGGLPARGFGVAVSKPGTYLTTPPAALTLLPLWLWARFPDAAQAGPASGQLRGSPFPKEPLYPPSQGTAQQGHVCSVPPRPGPGSGRR